MWIESTKKMSFKMKHVGSHYILMDNVNCLLKTGPTYKLQLKQS